MTRLLWGTLIYLAPIILAQDYRASVSGTVRDPSGLPVPSASLLFEGTAGEPPIHATAAPDGRYSLPYVRTGTYTVTARATGFRASVHPGVTLSLSDRITLDFELLLGAERESVIVTSSAGLLQRDTAVRGGTIEAELVASLPNAGRNAFQLVFTQPGTHKPSTAQVGSFDLDGVANAVPSINGASGGPSGRESTAEILLDGITDRRPNRGIAMIPALEAIDELQVLSTPYDAQYGGTGGGAVLFATRQGTSQYHGSVFERLADSRFAANTFANNRAGIAKPDLRQHNYGFRVNGPVLLPRALGGRNRIFFMLSWDTTPSEATFLGQASVPTEAMRKGDFSKLLAADGRPITIYDPLTSRPGPGGRFVRDLLPGNIIPAARINPVGAKILDYLPLPTSAGSGPAGVNNYIRLSPNRGSIPQWLGRLDFRPTSRHSFSGLYGETAQSRTGDIWWGTNAAEPTNILPRSRRGRTLGLDWTGVLQPALILNLRAGFARQENLTGNTLSRGFDQATLGFPGALVSQMTAKQFPLVTLGNYRTMGTERVSDYDADGSYSFQFSVSNARGAHLLKAGEESRSYRSSHIGTGAAAGAYNFDRFWTQANPQQGDALSGNEIASLLFGYPTSGYADINIDPSFANSAHALYFQDDWKASKRLRLSLGLRWDFETPLVERFRRVNRGFGYDQPSPLAARVGASPFALNCPVCSNLKGAAQFVGMGGQPDSSFNADYNNIQARFGAAYSVNNGIVVRGGYGLFTHTQSDYLQFGGSTEGFSRRTPYIPSADGVNPIASLSNPFPSGLLRPVGGTLGPNTNVGLGISANYLDRKSGQTHQYSFGVQLALGAESVLDVSYVGSYSQNLPVGANLSFIPRERLGQPLSYYNEGVANPMVGLIPANLGINGPVIPRSQLLLTFPQYTGIVLANIPAGVSRYDSAQVQLRRRFSHGFAFQANLSISKSLERLVYQNSQDFSLSDPLRPTMEKRLTPFDVPYKFSLLGSYDVPFGAGERFGGTAAPVVRAALGGWRLSWNLTFQAGFPIDFPNAAPLEARSAELASPARRLERWFDTSLFPRVSGPAPFTLKTFPSRFSDVRFQGVNNSDISVAKTFNLYRERVRATLRADVINSLNTPYFTQMLSLSVTAPQFGQIRPQQNNTGRVVFLEGKFVF